MVPFPSPIDELQHLSVVRSMAENPRLFPEHAQLKVLKPDLTGFGNEPNYLNHPSPYYFLMSAIAGAGQDSQTQVLRLRLANVALSAIAIAIMLIAGVAVLPDVASRFVFGLALVLFPKMPLVAGMINNDNLGLLAAAIVFAGLLRLFTKGDGWGAVLTGFGLALAGWTKLTAALMLGFVLGFCILIAMWRGQLKLRVAFAAAGIAILGLIPTMQNFLALGRPLFVSATHNAVPVNERPLLSLMDYVQLFFWQIAAKWPGLEPGNAIQMLIPLLIVLLCAFAVLLALRKGSSISPAAGTLIAGYMLALPASLLVHAFYGYQAFLKTGDLTSAQTRYYYALWPGLALALALLYANAPAGRPRVLGAGMVAVLLLLSSAFVMIAVNAAGNALKG